MTDTFEDLKLVPELVAGAQALGWDAPSGLQRDAVAVIRRGNNVVLHASAGSGGVGAYGLGILDRLARADHAPGEPAALVLVADFRDASATAASLARLAAPTTLSVRALGPGWAAGPGNVLVATAADALAAVRGSALKLDAIAALVIDGADLILDAGQWPAVETLADTIPGEAQRLVVTGSFNADIDGFIEGHVRRAMTVPPRSEQAKPESQAATVRYAVAPEGEKLAAAVRLLTDLDGGVAVVCRTVDRAADVETALAARGVLDAGDEHGTDIVVLPRPEADQRSVKAAVLSFDVPFDAAELEALHGNGGALVVTPRERAHLQRIAVRAGLRLEAVTTPTAPGTAVDALRRRLREAARGDITAEMALLEPLLAEVPAVELAAAAIRLTRTAGTAADTGAPGASAVPASPGPTGSAPPPEAGTWVHLFMDIGKRDEVGPGDIVGAITGEAGVSGDRVGKIDIRESHSTVEVATSVAARVIEALNGRTLKGRSLRVDYDRKTRGDGGSRPPSRRPS
ncbi:MAG: DbpA RNA binding domain-containing protein [Longimicrobiales bacterium]